MYRRILTGVISQGKTRDFLTAMAESNTYQLDRGIRARTAVWGAMTGQNNSIVIAADFNSLEDLEQWTDLSTEDSRFAVLRREVRSHMVYEGSEVAILRLSYHSEGLGLLMA